MISVLLMTLFFQIGALDAAELLHKITLHAVLRCPMSFNDTTPVGRILSRFSSDINTIDSTLPDNLKQTTVLLFRVCGLRLTSLLCRNFNRLIYSMSK